jgi:biofilm PGA synthesis N-glycosyltransferase PgaC
MREKWMLVVFVGALYLVTMDIFYQASTREYRSIAGFDSIRLVILVLLIPLLVKYVFQLLCSPLYSIFARRLSKQAEGNRQPFVSVLIPAWNEEVGIVKTIRSVLKTQYPRLQIVVINDGSTDGTHEKVTQFMADYQRSGQQNAQITYLNLVNGGKASAMNRALPHAEGEIVITIDADSVMDPQAITNLVKYFDDPQVGGVAGNVIVGNRMKPIEWMQQLEYLSGFFFKRTESLFNSVYIIGGAAAAYRLEVLHEMDGFDHSIITEDIEMSTRILSHGYKTRYAHDAVIYTEGPSDLCGLCNQRLRWKYGRILTFIKHRKLFFSLRPQHNPYLSFVVLPIAVYADLLLLTETVILPIFFLYTLFTNDYIPIVSVIALLTAVVTMQVLIDHKKRFHRNLLLLAPVAWLLFYGLDMVEFQALIRSLKLLATRNELKWQKWVRVGVVDEVCLSSQTADD